MPAVSRTRRLRTALAVGVLAAPLVAAPVVAPATAFTAVVDHRDGFGGAGSHPSYGGYGLYAGPGPDGWSADPYGATTTSTVDAQPATAAESTGVVLVETEIEYGTGEAAGTGLVLDSDGIVVTNHHVVQGATSVRVTVPGTEKTSTADVLGYDATHDVAVLQLRDASGLTAVATDGGGTSVGEQVTAVGNAEGAGSLTAADGSVTTARKAITVQEDDGSSARLRGLIEVDADVVSGDSGGALLDGDGQVIGMDVAASSGAGSISGYAIPIGRVLTIADRILAGDDSGPVTLGYEAALGVQLYDGATPVVAGTVTGGAAAGAGIASGSTVTAVDGADVASLADITGVLAHHQPGDTVTVAWTDAAGGSHTAEVTLGRAPLA